MRLMIAGSTDLVRGLKALFHDPKVAVQTNSVVPTLKIVVEDVPDVSILEISCPSVPLRDGLLSQLAEQGILRTTIVQNPKAKPRELKVEIPFLESDEVKDRILLSVFRAVTLHWNIGKPKSLFERVREIFRLPLAGVLLLLAAAPLRAEPMRSTLLPLTEFERVAAFRLLFQPTGLVPIPADLRMVGGTVLSSGNVVDGPTNAFRVNVVAGGAGGGIAQLQARSAANAWTDVGFSAGDLNVPVNCVVGCGSSSFLDNAAFTAGTTSITNVGAVFNDGLSAVTSGAAAAPRITNNRALHVNLRDASGNALLGQAAMVASVPVVIASNQSALSVTATNLFALDTSVNGLLLAQASTTSGQKGPLTLGAVTTAAPSYTTAQSDPLSLTTAGALRSDISTIAGTAPTTVGKLDVKGADGDVFVRQTAAANLNATVVGTITANQGTANATPWNENVATWIGSAAPTVGQKTMANSLPVALALDYQPSNVSVSGAITGTTCTGVPGSGIGCITLATAGLMSFGFQIAAAGTGALTFVPEFSVDGGTTYTATYMWSWTSSNKVTSLVLTNPNAAQTFSLLVGDGATHIRLRCTSFTSGSTTLTLDGSRQVFPVWYQATIAGIVPITGVPAMGADVSGNAQYLALRTASPANTELGLVSRTIPTPATLVVSTKSLTGASVTATLPAVAALFHYITHLRIVTTCTTAISGSAVLDVTSTNLPGTQDWMFGNACSVGSTNVITDQEYHAPLKSSVANTNTTIVCPALGTAGFCQIDVFYFTGS